MNDNQWQTNLLNINVWLRLLYMALTSIGMAIAWYLIVFIAVVQFVMVLITGKDNDNLRNFGQGVSKWVSQGLLFLTFNSDTKPYPFSEWPDIEATEPYVAPEVDSTPVADSDTDSDSSPATPTPTPAETTDSGDEAEVQLSDDFADDANNEPVEKQTDTPTPEADVPSFTGENSDNDEANTGEDDKENNEKT